MSRAPRYWGVIPASGVGKRMGGELPKQYLTLHGKTLLQLAIERMVSHPCIAGVVVAVAAHDDRWQTLEADFGDRVSWVTGGEERYHSVLNGLQALSQFAPQDDWALVHDAARPCLRADDIDHLIGTVNGRVGGILALPVNDTMKRTSSEGTITETVNRNGLWRALTPQMFRIGLLIEAINHAINQGVSITDEASAVESLGHAPMVVSGHPDNIKVTIPQDLELARLYLQQQRMAIEQQERNG